VRENGTARSRDSVSSEQQQHQRVSCLNSAACGEVVERAEWRSLSVAARRHEARGQVGN